MLKTLLILSGLILSVQVINANNDDLSQLVNEQVTIRKSVEPVVDAARSQAIHFGTNLFKITLASMTGFALGKVVLNKAVWKKYDHLTFEALIQFAASGVMFYGASNIIKELHGPISSHFFKFGAGCGIVFDDLGDH